MALVKIESRNLRFVSTGFEWIEGGGFACKAGTDNKDKRPHLTVLVDDDEYKTNIIDKIEDIFDDVVSSVVKYSGQVFVNTDNYDGDTKHIPIDIDPQPWLEEYQINIR